MSAETPLIVRLYVDQDMREPESCDIDGGVAVVFSSRAPEKALNEDAAAIIPYDANSGVLVVADGVGGVPAGEQASCHAIMALKSSIQQAAREGVLLRTAVINGIEKANSEIQSHGIGSATTLAAVEIQDNTVRPYHVGDSMIVVVGQRGKIKLQTISHSPVGYAVEAGLLDETEAMRHEDRHVVSNVIGTAEMRIELGASVKLAARDTLILASDGLFDNLRVEEIVEFIRKGPLPRAARELSGRAMARMSEPREGEPSKPDDLTFVVFRRSPVKRHAYELQAKEQHD